MYTFLTETNFKQINQVAIIILILQEQKAALKEDMQMKEFKAKRRSLGNIR